MKFFNGISIKSFLTAAVGFLVLLLVALSLNDVRVQLKDARERERVSIANRLADELIEAAGHHARERGVTAMALSSDAAASRDVLKIIAEARSKGDAALSNAYQDSSKLIAADPGNALLQKLRQRSESLFTDVKSARAKADSALHSSAKDYQSKDWFNAMTSLIETNAELRLTAFASTASDESLQRALRMNISLKQALWTLSEYAGRERAGVARFVEGKKPMDQATVERLNSIKTVINMNVKVILAAREEAGTPQEIVSAIDAMDAKYVREFGEIKGAVYAASSTGAYPLGGEAWIRKASEAIESVVAVSALVGRNVEADVAAGVSVARRSIALSVAVLLMVICVGAAAFFVIRRKVVAPMTRMTESMAHIEKTNDLTVEIPVESRDENGRMAESFNGMVRKFHDMIGDIHSSIDHLASSSSQLSAAGVQIASGCRNQSARASAVAAAAHELSVTISEVSRNVNGVSAAAREASEVAEKGGSIVAKSIESMNGISDSARRSGTLINGLGKRSEEIGRIINVINDIADQTNLLALNAAIEAARAGDQGRGFAVVADEVKKLAEKTMAATNEIGGMIKGMQDEMNDAVTSVDGEIAAVEQGVRLVDEAGAALKEIVSKVEAVSSMVESILSATNEQSAATEQITGDIGSVAEVINDTSTGADHIAQASAGLSEMSSNLKMMVDAFRISGGAASAGGKMVAGNVIPLRPARAANG